MAKRIGRAMTPGPASVMRALTNPTRPRNELASRYPPAGSCRAAWRKQRADNAAFYGRDSERSLPDRLRELRSQVFSNFVARRNVPAQLAHRSFGLLS